MWKNQTVKSHIFSYFKVKRAAKTTRYNLQGQSWLLLSQINIKNEWRFCSARKLTCALHDILHQGKNNYKWHYCCTLACLYQVESSSLCSDHKDLGWSPNPFCPTDQLFRGEHSLQDQIHHQHLKMKDANLTEVLLQKKLKLEHYKRRMIRIDKVVHISKKKKKEPYFLPQGDDRSVLKLFFVPGKEILSRCTWKWKGFLRYEELSAFCLGTKFIKLTCSWWNRYIYWEWGKLVINFRQVVWLWTKSDLQLFAYNSNMFTLIILLKTHLHITIAIV